MKKKKFVLILFFISSNITAFSQSLFDDANAFNIGLNEIEVLDVCNMNFKDSWNVIFLEDKEQIVYSRKLEGSHKHDIIIRDIRTLETITKFEGQYLIATSPDENRVFYSNAIYNAIYDIKEKKSYELGRISGNHHYWDNGKKAWLEDDKIISYKFYTRNGKTYPETDYWHYLDLNDLQIKKMSKTDIYNTIPKLEKRKPKHKNFYLYRDGSVYIKDKYTPYYKTLVAFKSGYPIKRYWASPNLEYLVVFKHSQRYSNTEELVLYKLKYSFSNKKMFFSASDPRKWFGEEFKPVYRERLGLGIWVSVYEPKINPLNNKKLGPDKSKYIGDLQIIKILDDGKIGLQMGYDNNKEIKSGYIISNFRKDKYIKDKNGAWVTLSNWNLIESCDCEFKPFSKGDDSKEVLCLKRILNSNPNTKISNKGTDSPGNESSLATENTILAIKKFQKFYGLNPTGNIDSRTQILLRNVCEIINKKKAMKRLRVYRSYREYN